METGNARRKSGDIKGCDSVEKMPLAAANNVASQNKTPIPWRSLLD